VFDELWPGGAKFKKAPGVFKLGTDSVMLAHFTASPHAKKCVDLGSGAGVLAVLLGDKMPEARFDCVEIQPESAALSEENLCANGLADRTRVFCRDLREYRQFLEAGAYDLVVSNPPYFSVGSGYTAPEEDRATARDERMCSLSELCEAAAWLCRWGGVFTLVHRPERLSEAFCALTAVGLEPKRLRMVQHRADAKPNLVLIEARRGGKPGLTVEAPLLLTVHGEDSPEVKTIYHR